MAFDVKNFSIVANIPSFTSWQLPNGFWSVRTMYTNLHTKIFTLKHGKFEKKLTLEGQWLLYNIWQVLLCFETTENSRILAKYKRFWVQNGRKLLGCTKPAWRHAFLRLSLARFFREGKYAISRENLANESLRNAWRQAGFVHPNDPNHWALLYIWRSGSRQKSVAKNMADFHS